MYKLIAQIASKDPSPARGPKHEDDPDVVSSFSVLKQYKSDVKATIQASVDTHKKIDAHFEKAMASYSDPLPLYRTIDEIDIPNPLSYETVNQSSTFRKLTLTNCHHGQRKLTMALLEFISSSLTKLRCAPRDVFLVYAGASGLASAVASAVFPGIRMALYDYAPNILSHIPPSFTDKVVFKDTHRVPYTAFRGKSLAIFTGKAGWFSDEVALHCRNILFPQMGVKHILFTSDVRDSDREEAVVAQDMLDQQRWTVLTGCSAYMHKFRIPYMDKPEAKQILQSYRSFANIPTHMYEYVYDAKEKKTTSSFPYLDGRLFIQLYARQRTAELRLMGFAKKTGFYVIRDYGTGEVENKMATFNTVYRGHARFKYDGRYTPPRDSYLPASYDVVAEHAIISQCAHSLKGDYTQDDLCRMHDTVQAMLASFSHKDPLVCSLISAANELNKNRLHASSHVPHVVQWAEQVLRVAPNATIPKFT